jgi:hypothetical protein
VPLRLEATLSNATRPDGPGLLLRYRLQGDVESLAVPQPATAGPADGLWQHTCFEAFVGHQQGSAYREFNFSPSGQWAAYRFCDERVRDHQPGADHAVFVPTLSVGRSPDTLVVEAWLPTPLLPCAVPGEALCFGLSAVIETRERQFSYWALRHPRDKPDFHHAEGRSLKLMLPLGHGRTD